METLNYKVLESTGYNGYILKDAPVKVMQFGEGNFLRAFIDWMIDKSNEAGKFNGMVQLVQPRTAARFSAIRMKRAAGTGSTCGRIWRRRVNSSRRPGRGSTSANSAASAGRRARTGMKKT